MLEYAHWGRTAAVVAAMSLGGSLVTAAETYDLRPVHNHGDVDRVEITIEAGGELKLVEESKVQTAPMSVRARIQYGQKLVAGDPAAPESLRGVRYYSGADATLAVDKEQFATALAEERRLVSVGVDAGQPLLASLSGPLTRDELDLIDVHGNSLLVESLLPGEPVQPGDRWQHDPQLMAALVGLDAISQSDIASTLVEVKGPIAQLEMTGKAQGAFEGVSSEVEVKARYQFDLDQKRITWVGMLVKEQRSIGHVSTGLDVVAKLQMRIVPKAVYPELSDDALAGIRLETPSEQAFLAYESGSQRFRLLHDRRWHVMAEQPQSVALRLVDRGELVAQCNVTAIDSPKDQQAPSLADFQKEIEKSLGDSFGQFLNASESTDDQGRTIYRAIVSGMVSELPIQWNYYLVIDRDGRQTALVFTLEGGLVERFGAADTQMVSLLEALSPPVETAAQPTLAQPRE